MANTTIPNLPPAISLDGTELWELVQNGVSRRATTQQLVNLASSGTGTVTLINTAGALTGGPITGSGTISLAANAVTNQYLAPMGPGTLKGNLTGSTADPQDVTVNAVLDSIGATPGSMLYRGAGAWALVPPGTTGQYLTTSGAVPQWGNLSVGPSSLTPTGVSAGTYGTASAIPQFTVLASGQLSAAGNVSIQISTSQVTGLGTMATQNATAVAITGGTMNGVVIGGGAPAAASFTNILAGTWLGTAIGVAYGGTGATTAPGARSNLGAAASGAVGSSGITMATARLLGRSTAGTGAIEEITIGANLTLSGGVLSATGGGGGGSGTVTSIDVSGGTTGLTTSGGPVTTSGTITLAGTLGTANGGTGLSSWTAGDLPFYATGTSLSKLAIGAANTVLTSSGTAPQWSTSLTLAGTVSATKFIPVSGGTVTGNGMYLSATNEISFSTNGVRRFTILDGGYYTFSDTARVGVSTSPSTNLADGLGVYNGRDLSVWSSSTATTGDYARIGWNGSIPRLLYGNSSISNGTDFAIQVQGSVLPQPVMYFRGDGRVKVGVDTTYRGSASSGAATWGTFQVGSNNARNESIFLLNDISTAALSILATSGDLQLSTFDARNIIFGRNFNTTFVEAMRLTSTGGMTVSGTTTLSALTASTVLTLNASKEIVGVTSVPVANGGTGQTSYTNGQLLIGNSTGNTLTKATLTAGSGISITNGAGSITITATGGGGGTATNLAGGAAGSVPYQSAVDTTTFLAIGAANRVMTSSGTAPQWSTSLALAADSTFNGVTIGRGASSLSNNTAVGASTLTAITTGNSNTGIGVNALKFLQSGSSNTAVGADAMSAFGGSGSAIDCVAVGSGALPGSTLANITNCVAIGARALGNGGLTSGNNIAIGSDTLSAATSGNNNVAIGVSAGIGLTTGQENVLIGNLAGSIPSITTGSTNIVIGYNITVDSATASNQINIGGRYFHNRIILGDTTPTNDLSLTRQAAGVLTLAQGSTAAFNRLQFGGTTSSFPAIKRNAAAINIRLADDSADADLTAGALTLSGATTLNALTASTVLTLNASKVVTAVTSVPVANGGTGATDAATARTNLTAQKTITSGTATPTGGSDGDIYLQYT